MNKDWSEKNREIQKLLNRKDTYKEGIDQLIEFRQELFEQITQIVNTYLIFPGSSMLKICTSMQKVSWCLRMIF